MPPLLTPGMDPIQAKWRDTMQMCMDVLTEQMPGVGLCLFLFDIHLDQPRANYIANTPREQTVSAIREWLSRQAAHMPAPDAGVSDGPHTTPERAAFDDAMMAVILSRFKELAAEAVKLVEHRAAAALVEADAEIQEVQAALDAAKLIAPASAEPQAAANG